MPLANTCKLLMRLPVVRKLYIIKEQRGMQRATCASLKELLGRRMPKCDPESITYRYPYTHRLAYVTD